MVNREILLDLAGRKHARAIYEYIRDAAEHDESHAYYNKLCRTLKIPSATVNRYLYLLDKNGIIEGNWEEIDVTETLEKGRRHRAIWVRIWRPKDTEERRVFEALLYGKH